MRKMLTYGAVVWAAQNLQTSITHKLKQNEGSGGVIIKRAMKTTSTEAYSGVPTMSHDP